MDYNILITFLQEKQYLTDLEKDILDTWNELQKNPFDRSAAQRQVLQNDAKYPEIFFAIKSMPTTVSRREYPQMFLRQPWLSISSVRSFQIQGTQPFSRVIATILFAPPR